MERIWADQARSALYHQVLDAYSVESKQSKAVRFRRSRFLRDVIARGSISRCIVTDPYA